MVCFIDADDLQAAEEKYSNELVQRSENVKELSKMKTELIQYQHEVKQLKHEEENARERLREGKKMWEEQEVNYNKEINVLKEQIVELNEQNCALHDSLQELGSQVALLKAQVIVMYRIETELFFNYFVTTTFCIVSCKITKNPPRVLLYM